MTITVSQLNNYIHGVLDIDGVLSNVSVRGEVTNLKRARDGWYFSLKDDIAAINCFCYDSMITPQAGTVVIAEGQVNYFVKSGSLSLFVRRLTSTDKTGEAYLRFVELKDKLRKEGLFDDERKVVIPHCCSKIGIVTSETGAVIHDITNVALRRQPFVNLVLYPVKVQGIGAESEIAQGINYFSESNVDVVIVGRGGGSNEDLSVFNTEIVVRAVASCLKPVVSAVGHGVDFTLCDFAADRRAVTPSEAAEFVTIDVAVAKDRIYSVISKINNDISAEIKLLQDRVSYLIKNVNSRAEYTLQQATNHVVKAIGESKDSVCRLMDFNQHGLDAGISKLNSLNPLNVLQRGYAYVRNNNGVVKSVEQINVGDEVTLSVTDGTITAHITAKEKK